MVKKSKKLLLGLNVNFQSSLWNPVKSIEEDVITIANLVIDHFPLYKKKLILDVTLADDAFVQDLNKNYRHKDKATNVLSFPLEDLKKGTFFPKMACIYLGDMVFSFETIQKEAIEKKISFQNHFFHLCIHSFLHLLGYTHDLDKEAEEMENLEVQLLSKLAVADPYGEIR